MIATDRPRSRRNAQALPAQRAMPAAPQCRENLLEGTPWRAFCY